MLDGLAVVFRGPLVVKLETLIQFIHGGLVAPASDQDLDRYGGLAAGIHGLLARAVRFVPQFDALNRVSSRTQARQAQRRSLGGDHASRNTVHEYLDAIHIGFKHERAVLGRRGVSRARAQPGETPAACSGSKLPRSLVGFC